MNITDNFKRIEERIDGEKKYRLIWISNYDKYVFPTYRVISGSNYSQVDYIISKPHGFKDIMMKMLLFLNKKDKYRWSTFEKKFRVDNSFEEVITILINAGVLQIKEKNLRPAKKEEWVKLEVALDERALTDVNALLEDEESLEIWKLDLLGDIDKILAGVEEEELSISKRLQICMKEGIEKLNNLDTNFPCSIKFRKKYRAFLLTIAYANHLIFFNKTMPLRTLSSIICDDSKMLDRYIDEIVSYVGVQLYDMGITTHPETIWIYGAGEYNFNNKYNVSLMAAMPSILSEDTIEESKFIADSALKYILIVENLTAFIHILKKEYYNRGDTIVIWSQGYWNSKHKKILKDILTNSNNKINVYIWCDIDIDGILIASNIYNWIINFNCIAKFVLMDNEAYNLCNSNRKLTERELMLINKCDMLDYFNKLLINIKAKGVTVEQEMLLNYFEYVKLKLP